MMIEIIILRHKIYKIKHYAWKHHFYLKKNPHLLDLFYFIFGF